MNDAPPLDSTTLLAQTLARAQSRQPGGIDLQQLAELAALRSVEAGGEYHGWPYHLALEAMEESAGDLHKAGLVVEMLMPDRRVTRRRDTTYRKVALTPVGWTRAGSAPGS